MSAKERKQLALDLLERCKKENIILSTDDQTALLQVGTMLMANRDEDGFHVENTFKAMVAKYGQRESHEPKSDKKKSEKTSDKKSRKTNDKKSEESNKRSIESQDTESTVKKIKKVPQATCSENQLLTEAFEELSGYEFKLSKKFPAMAYKKVAKAIREHETPILSGKEAAKIKGIGKASANKIDEYLETGKIEKLEEYRREGI